MPASRADALELLAAARRAVPSIPTITTALAPATAATIAASGAAAVLQADAAVAELDANASLVGRRVMATFLDAEGASQWYPAIIVGFRPRATIFRHIVCAFR